MLKTPLRKKAQDLHKAMVYKLFQWKHGRLKGTMQATAHPKVEVKTVKMDQHSCHHVYTIHGGRLYTDRIHDTAVIVDQHVIAGPSFQYRGQLTHEAYLMHKHADRNTTHRIGTPRPLRHLKGSVLSLLTGGGGNNNYFHWLYDVLPRLAICEHLIQREHIDYFLLPSDHLSFQRESLAMLNIPEEKQLPSKIFRHILADTLYITGHPTLNLTWITSWLHHSFTPKAETQALRSDKIYINRSDATASLQHRSITNEKEVQHYLRERGFDMVRLSDYSFSDQINIFAHAKVIVGLHGAGFANLAFCQPNTKVIEIKSYNANETIARIAHAKKLNYQAIVREPINRDASGQQGHITVPIDLLHTHLKAFI